MEFAGEDIEIKEEPISTDPYQLPEIEQIYIKEENVKLETPEDNDARDPLNVEEDEFVSEEEAGSPPDAIHIKKEPEVQIEAEPTSCDSEPESIIAVGLVDDNRNGGNGSFVSRAEQPPASDSAMQCSTNQNESVPPMIQLQQTLRYFASDDFLLSIGDFIGIDKGTASRIIKGMCITLDNIHEREFF
ncbi:uncharacterized protein LOC124551234 isoform X1 [Schistocerca americana]|uniref:uncharacterized protein LOC124551234 isoform X1 n=1 Tax=Schistocerca americana TaxID=7009 RepID=UPI001F50411D|nr:uncharacterized protein LOC124551234 isoform X1 [Schistocerca americana]